MSKKILVSCINYNNSSEVCKYADDISKQENNKDIILIVTDNSTIEKEYEKLKDEIKKIKLEIILLKPNKNLGYLNGMFLGVKKYFEIYEQYPEWTVFSNTDIEFKKSSFFSDFMSRKYNDDIWCIAPSLYSSLTKSYQNPQYKERISRKKLDFLIFISKYSIIHKIYEMAADFKAKFKKNIKDKSCEIYSAHGAFFILKDCYFKSLKKLEYGTFLYSEESFISETIINKGKKIFYDDELELIHREHSSTSLIGIKKRSKYINESLKYIKKEFYTGE